MNQPSVRRTLAENLRIIRLVRHLSQEALAELVDLDRSYVSGLERAEYNIGVDNLEKIARALGITIVDLLSEPDPGRLGGDVLEAVRGAVDRKRVREEAAVYLVERLRVPLH